jgi:hypothetical protein
MNRRLIRLVTVPVVVLGAAGTAWGFWTAQIAPGSHGAAAATVVDDGAMPSGVSAGNRVTVTWPASSLGSGGAVGGYQVRRYDAETGAEQPVGTGCTGTVAVATCTESGVADGRWRYTVTPTVGTSWRGATSALSTPVVVDTTAPTGGTVTVTGLGGTGAAYATSTSLTLALTPATDLNGIKAGAKLNRVVAPLTNGTCGTFGTAVTLVATDPAGSVANTVPTPGRCYRYDYVVTDNHGNSATFTSQVVKVDTTAPVTTLSLARVSASSWTSGSTAYYRPSVGGSFRVTATGDTESGVSAYSFPDLGAGWSGTVNGATATYSWTASPEPPAAPAVTVTNNAGLTGQATAFSVVPDPTAPEGGTLTYRDGFSTADHVNLSWTAGSDAGSGIASRVIQRATATLAGGVCGSFGAFGNIVNGVEPTAVRRDPVRPGRCYQYRLVVTDRVGNQGITIGTSIVKVVDSDYAAAVKSTSGLAGFWRLGEATSVADSFTGPAGAKLASRSGEVGPRWVSDWDAATSADAVLTAAGRLRRNDPGGLFTGSFHHLSVNQDDADYTVEADLHVASLAQDAVRLVGRYADASSGFSTLAAGYDQATQAWQIYRLTDDDDMTDAEWMRPEATAPEQLVAGTTYHVALEMRGSTVRLLVDGVERLTAVDPEVRAGTAGLALGLSFHPDWAQGTVLPVPIAPASDTTGMHVDNFRVTPSLRRDDDALLSDGHYLRGATTGVAGAPFGDENTAISLDGVDDEAHVSTTLADDLTLELFFRSPQGAGGADSWTAGAPIVHVDGDAGEDLGISLTADGRVVAGLGGTSVATDPALGRYDDDAWHHVALTRTASTGELVLHVDGKAAGSVVGSTAPLGGPATLHLGVAAGGTRLTGALDEVALYSRSLASPEVEAHHASAQEPVAP